MTGKAQAAGDLTMAAQLWNDWKFMLQMNLLH